jgi:hypothetical protein
MPLRNQLHPLPEQVKRSSNIIFTPTIERRG